MLMCWWSNLRPNLLLIWPARIHWKWRVWSVVNIFGSIFVYTMVWSIILLGLGEVIPYLYGPGLSLHKIFSWFLAIQVAGNMFLMLSIKTDTRTLRGIAKKDEEWKFYCQVCESRIPPRGHHCWLCNKCVIKRDHHCFFVSCCIGFHNQKYFVLFLFYACLSTLYSFFTMPYYLESKYYIEFTSIFSYATLLPVTLYNHFFLEDTNVLGMFFIMLMYMSLFCAFFTGGIIGFQGFLIYRGQSTYELMYSTRDYDRGWWHNFLDCFGPYWYLSVVLPLPLPQSHNGIYEVSKSLNDPIIRDRYEYIMSLSC